MFSRLNQGQICAYIVHFTVCDTIYYLHVYVQTKTISMYMYSFFTICHINMTVMLFSL